VDEEGEEETMIAIEKTERGENLENKKVHMYI
jgi:hypothetical protein